MCEHEGKKEFCDGIIEVFQEAKLEMEKLSHKILVEESKGKLCAWDINQSMILQDTSNFEGYKNFVTDITEEDEIEFKMLNEMVTNGKMSFFEAIVLIVRERAMMIDQNNLGNSLVVGAGTHSNIGSADFNDINTDRSRSQSVGQNANNIVNVSELIKRINLKGRYLNKQQSSVINEISDETKKKELELKQKRAMELREEMKSKKIEKLLKKEEKLESIKKKREETGKGKIEEFIQKIETGIKRRTNYIDERIRKARELNSKARETIFLSILDKDLKKTTIDRKLLETHQRRIEILNKRKEKNKKEDDNIQAVQTRKEGIDNEKKSNLMSKFDKYGEAYKRRAEILEQRIKRSKMKSRKHLKRPIDSGQKNLKEFLKNFMNAQQFRPQLDELEMKSCYVQNEKESPKRSRSLTIDPCDVTGLNFPYIFYKPKVLIKKSKKAEPFMNLEQVLTKKIRPANNLTTTTFKKSTISSKKDSTLIIRSDTNNIISSSFTTNKKPIHESAMKSDKKKSVVERNSNTAKNEKNNDTNMVLNNNSNITNDSPKKKPPHKNSGHSIEIKEKTNPTSKNSNPAGLLANTNTSQSNMFANLDINSPTVIHNESKEARLEDLTSSGGLGIEKKHQSKSVKSEDQMNLDELQRHMIRFCTLCDIVLIEEVTNEQHLTSKNHKRLKNQYSLTVNEEKTSIITCLPTELAASRLLALKKKCKRIRQTISTYSTKNESYAFGKENLTSPNKTRLHKHSVDMEKSISNQFKDFKIIETTLKDVQKILASNNENDLHILRTNKFISYLIEVTKSVNVCHKNDLGPFVKLLDNVVQLIYVVCSVKENRTYMLITNRVIPLVDLLLWSWNNASKYIYCLNYIPQLFHLIGFLMKHKIGEFKEKYKEPVLEYIIYCGLLIKLKQRFTSFSSGLDLTSYAGKIPLALLKAISMLEVVTSHLEVPNIPFFTQTRKLNESISFLFKETEVAGCLQLMSGLLLSGGSFKKQNKSFVLPQTIFSVVMLIIKIFSNVARLEFQLLQEVLGSEVNLDQFYHCIIFILDYSITNIDNNDEIHELLNETILLLGYFCYLNTTNQNLLSRGYGNNTILSKLLALPYNYFMGKTMEMDVLFPTLLSAVYRHTANLKIILKEMSVELLIDYIQSNLTLINKHIQMKDPKTFDPSMIPSIRDDMTTSISVSSGASSANSIRLHPSSSYHFLLPQRFSYEHWEPALLFLKENEK